MSSFEAEYKKLNDKQKQAVDKIEGPVLVIAGPGTGKTQLLSMRVANILRTADVLPQNILCLTFTDNAARNMQGRLESIAGQPAYHVAIHTFHSFGELVINQYPDFFTDRLMVQAIDRLGSYEVLHEIFENLPHDNPLSAKAGGDYVFLKDTLSVISWLKANAVQPSELTEILTANQAFFKAANPLVHDIFKTVPSAKLIDSYRDLAAELGMLGTEKQRYGSWDYGCLAAKELAFAVESSAIASGRYAPSITAWRKDWLEKNPDGEYVFKDSARSSAKLTALSAIYASFQAALAERGLYDFDDMIMEVVRSIETYNELKFNLQERFQYMLVDEFQDTNSAQLRILAALSDNPLFEGRPNLMAVGDPNQAIYSFQGSLSAAVAGFMGNYRDVSIIVLGDNYRSSQAILDASSEIIRQLPAEEKALGPENLQLKAVRTYKETTVEHDVLDSELAQYQWLSGKISGYIDAGIRPEEIAVIAPRHRYLERLMPYLASQHIPVAYERRENILDSPIISQLIRMAELVVALSKPDYDQSDALFAEVLNYDYWELPGEAIMKISLNAYDKHVHWLPQLLKTGGKISNLAEWFVGLAKSAASEPLEYILDALSGTPVAGVDEPEQDELPQVKPRPGFLSPFTHYYFGSDNFDTRTDEYLSHLGQLATLRQHLRAWRPNASLHLEDLIEFVRLHRQTGIKIVDNNPHTQAVNAVQVMTAYKAKGLEFEVVFAINAQDEVWGPKARHYSERVRLPRNLPIKPTGDSEADKLRLFFVALTRAEHSLHITSYSRTLDNKLSLGLSFIGGNGASARPPHDGFKPNFIKSTYGAEAARILSTDWAYRYRQIIADKPALFEPVLDRYLLSATHFNNFLDAADGGPGYFLLHNLLRFPAAMSAPAAYGDAIHRTLQWIYTELREQGELPPARVYHDYFSDLMERKHLRAADFKRYLKRGLTALDIYLEQKGDDFSQSDIIEHSFAKEGVVISGIKLTGKIDKIRRGSGNNISVIDFKTGKPSPSWQGKDDYEKRKLHRYRQQLIFYKLLIENSASYGGRFVLQHGALEFIELGDQKNIVELKLDYDPDEVTRLTALVKAVWQHIMELNFPNTSAYSKDLKGIEAFENDLLSGDI